MPSDASSVKWLRQPEDHDYAAAESYLTLTYPAAQAGGSSSSYGALASGNSRRTSSVRRDSRFWGSATRTSSGIGARSRLAASFLRFSWYAIGNAAE